LTPASAEGVTGGYVEIENWMKQLTKNASSHHLSAAAAPASSMYKVIRRLADAYPDPETGENTHISHAYKVEATQVFIIHPDEASSIAKVN
jgi:7-keto-8-aminopelargonate synthetase-like enzyme